MDFVMKCKERNNIRWLGSWLILALGCVGTMAAQTESRSEIAVGEHRMVIEHDGFRFGFMDPIQKLPVPMHAQSGLMLDGQSVVSAEAHSSGKGSYTVSTATGLKALVMVEVIGGRVAITVDPEKEASSLVAIRLGGMPVAYGLGDTGGWNESLNLVGDQPKEYRIHHDGGRHRWLSSFAVFPEYRIAGVVIGGTDRKVSLGPESYTMSVKAEGPVTFYYLLGDLPSIYRNYRALLTVEGFPHVKPKFRLFELGWESWAALGWQTNAKTMLDSINRFQELGYPVRWAVSGSGYWEEGGTTTSFGKFGKKFSPAEAFKQSLHERDVKWMIGLRTNFVPPGGPHWPVTKERDQNMVVDSFHGNPLSQEALDQGYFLKNPDGQLWKKHSGCFPIVPCYLLDGANPEAVAWYSDLYKQWGVDGIKEDTMMGMGSTHTGVFDQPMARIAEEGALVMARCGSFSAPGTLLRINDTSVNDMTRRTPINYLQYAASGAPNVYSDTVGFKRMKSYSEQVVRHAWLMALTAGMAVGESPEAWSDKQQAIFKKPFDFHYRFGPYLFDAAMKSHQTGYPVTMTPLGIAYPDDEQARDPDHFQWMAGESLLCAPLLKNHSSGSMDVYLPVGTWFDYDTGGKYTGPRLLMGFAMPVDKTPCFVGGKGILVARESDQAPLRAHIYPVDAHPAVFTFHHPDGVSTSTLRLKKNGTRGVWNAQSGEPVAFEVAEESGALSFQLQPGVDYEYSFGNDPERNFAKDATVSASSYRGDYVPGSVKDGIVSDASRWLAAEDDPKPWVELAFPAPQTVGMIDVFSGWKQGSRLEAFFHLNRQRLK